MTHIVDIPSKVALKTAILTNNAPKPGHVCNLFLNNPLFGILNDQWQGRLTDIPEGMQLSVTNYDRSFFVTIGRRSGRLYLR